MYVAFSRNNNKKPISNYNAVWFKRQGKSGITTTTVLQQQQAQQLLLTPYT